MAKPRKKTTSNLLTMPTPVSTIEAPTPTRTDIAARAFELYCERGCQQGHDLEDWLRAEREVRERASSSSTAA